MTYETADIVAVKSHHYSMLNGVYEFVGYHEPGVCIVTKNFCDTEIYVLEETVHLICKRSDRKDIGDKDAS